MRKLGERGRIDAIFFKEFCGHIRTEEEALVCQGHEKLCLGSLDRIRALRLTNLGVQRLHLAEMGRVEGKLAREHLDAFKRESFEHEIHHGVEDEGRPQRLP